MRDVELGLMLDPVFWDKLPEVRIEFNKNILFNGTLNKTKQFLWTLPAENVNRISVFFLNKKDSDTVDKLDKAVIITELSIEGLKYDSFLHLSKYKPMYSQGYYDYAKTHNIEVTPVIHSNYMGFNGEWFLEFTWPVFTWIYETETNKLGWIYEKNI